MRQPSAKIHRRLFPASNLPESAAVAPLAEVWRWLVPAMGCFLLAVAALGPRHGQLPYFAGMGTNNLLATMAGGSQSFAPYTALSYHTEKNNVPVSTVEAAFGRSSASPDSVFASAETNHLTH